MSVYRFQQQSAWSKAFALRQRVWSAGWPRLCAGTTLLHRVTVPGSRRPVARIGPCPVHHYAAKPPSIDKLAPVM
jgi:hypothetical protein